MLRLHHMNLLNEMQETAMMMNLAQQRMLQEQLQQQHNAVPTLQTSPAALLQQQMAAAPGATMPGLGNNAVFLAAIRQQMLQQPPPPPFQQQLLQQQTEEDPELQDGLSCSSTSTEEGEDRHPVLENGATLKEHAEAEPSSKVNSSAANTQDDPLDETAASKRPLKHEQDQEERTYKRLKTD